MSIDRERVEGDSTGGDARASTSRPAAVELVMRRLRAHHFAILSTVDEDGAPHSAGVNYGVSERDGEVILYVMTRRHLKKARNIVHNPRVSIVVPLQRQLFRFVPPATIQLRGVAEIIDWNDFDGTSTFRGFWIGRRILDAYEKARRRGEKRVCFLRITLDPEIRFYGVGHSVWDLRRHMEAAAGRVYLEDASRNAQGPPRAAR